jgi:hypothetical protein
MLDQPKKVPKNKHFSLFSAKKKKTFDNIETGNDTDQFFGQVCHHFLLGAIQKHLVAFPDVPILKFKIS